MHINQGIGTDIKFSVKSSTQSQSPLLNSYNNNMNIKQVYLNTINDRDQKTIQGVNSVSSNNAYHKVANLFTNQLQSQQQQQQQQQYLPQNMLQKFHMQQQDLLNQQTPQSVYESVELKIASQQSAYNSPSSTHRQPQIYTQSSDGRNQSPYQCSNSYLFSNSGNKNIVLEKQTLSSQFQQNAQQSNINNNNNFNSNNTNSSSTKCHSISNTQFELRDLQQERQNMKMSNNYPCTEENSPMQLSSQDRFNFHKQRELSKISRQESEDQNRKMHQTINDLEGEWNKIKKNHNLDNRSQSPFNNSLNNSISNIQKINSSQIGQHRFSDQLNRDQCNSQVSENNSIHDQSYDNTIKTQGSVKSLTGSCKRIKTQGDSTNNNSSLNKIIITPSKKQKDQSTSNMKKTQIINKSIPLSKINLDQMKTNSYSSRSNGEQITQYTSKTNGPKQNTSQNSHRNSLNNSNTIVSPYLSSNNYNNQNSNSVQNKSPISRSISQDEFNAPKSQDSTFSKIQEKYQNVHKQKITSKNQDQNNQSGNLSSSQLNYTNSSNIQQIQQQTYSSNPNNISNGISNNNLMNQQNSESCLQQQQQKNSFSDLSASPHQSQIISQYSNQNIGNGSTTFHQYPSILSQASINQNHQQFQSSQQPSSSLQRYTSSSHTNHQISQTLPSQNELGNQANTYNQDSSDIFQFNTQTSNTTPFGIISNKQPASYRNQVNSYSINTNNQQQNQSTNNSANNSFSSKQHHPNGIKKDNEQNIKPQLHSVSSSMQQFQGQQNQTMNFFLNSNYLTSTTVNTPSCTDASRNIQNPNKQSEQGQLSALDQSNTQQSRATSQSGFTDVVLQANQFPKLQQQSNSSHSKEKQIIQPVRASPMKKMISDVKPQNQQYPQQIIQVKSTQGNNNSCITYNKQNINGNQSGSNLSYQNNNNNQQPSIQTNNCKKDMQQMIMNKIKKMNVARISLNEEEDQFIQSTDIDQYSQNTIGKSIPTLNVKTSSQNSTQVVNDNDYFQSLHAQNNDYIQKAIQFQQLQPNQQQEYENQYSEIQSNNIQSFSSSKPNMIPKDAISPRSIPSFIGQISNDTIITSQNNILQNQKFFQSNCGNDKIGNQSEQACGELIIQKQKSNQCPSKIIISQSNVQQTPINQKKISNNINYSQKLLDSIQKHAKIHQENQQNLYSTPSNGNNGIKKGIAKMIINNTIKKQQSQTSQQQQSQHSSQMSTQSQVQPMQLQQTQVSPQLSSVQQQKVYNQALKSYQSSSLIQQPSVQQQQLSNIQQLPQKQIQNTQNINQTSAFNFSLNSPIAKKIY